VEDRPLSLKVDEIRPLRSEPLSERSRDVTTTASLFVFVDTPVDDSLSLHIFEVCDGTIYVHARSKVESI